MLPPLVVRRLVLAPLMIVLTVLAITGLPVCCSLRPRRRRCCPAAWRPLRLLWMVLLYMILESVALVVLFALWVASGFGWRIRSPWFQRAHYAIVRWFLKVLFWECQRVLHVHVDVEGPPPTSYDGKPLLILSRHAGPGDSFLLVHALVNWYAREPRIVLKDTMQWDPAIEAVPVLCGAAFKNKGVQPLLDAIIDYLLSPLDVPPIKGSDPKTGEPWCGAPTTTSRSPRSSSS